MLGKMPHPRPVRAGGDSGGQGTVLPEKGVCHKTTAILSLAGQLPSSTPEMGSDFPRAAQPRTEAGFLERSGRASCTRSSPQGSRAGRRDAQAGAKGLFCSVSWNQSPAGLSDTCGSAHSSSRTSPGCPTVTAVPRPWAPGRCFSSRGPSGGSWRGERAGKAYFWNSCLAGGPEEA